MGPPGVCVAIAHEPLPTVGATPPPAHQTGPQPLPEPEPTGNPPCVHATPSPPRVCGAQEWRLHPLQPAEESSATVLHHHVAQAARHVVLVELNEVLRLGQQLEDGDLLLDCDEHPVGMSLAVALVTSVHDFNNDGRRARPLRRRSRGVNVSENPMSQLPLQDVILISREVSPHARPRCTPRSCPPWSSGNPSYVYCPAIARI